MYAELSGSLLGYEFLDLKASGGVERRWWDGEWGLREDQVLDSVRSVPMALRFLGREMGIKRDVLLHDCTC